MNFFYKYIYVLFIVLILNSCAIKGVFSPCHISGAEFSKTGLKSVSLRFDYTGACDFRLNKVSNAEWIFEIPAGDFDNFTPIFDEFSKSKILYTKQTVGRFITYFNSDVDIEVKNEGSKRVFIIKEYIEAKNNIGNIITSAICLNNISNFLLKINGNGILPYEYGKISKNSYYLDVFSSNIDENFNLSKECKEFIIINKVLFPDRIRFIVNSSEASLLKPYTNSSSIILSKSTYENEKYILNIEEINNKNIQTIRVFTSSKVTPKINNSSSKDLIISFKEKILFSDNIKNTALSLMGSISNIKVDKSKSQLILLKSNNNLDVYVEETYYGFDIYIKGK